MAIGICYGYTAAIALQLLLKQMARETNKSQLTMANSIVKEKKTEPITGQEGLS